MTNTAEVARCRSGEASVPKRHRLAQQLDDLDQRTERQLAAIEAGVDPALVSQRIEAPKKARRETEIALAQLDQDEHAPAGFDLNDASAVLDALPDLSAELANADPQLRRKVYEAFRLSVELDRNRSQIRLQALDRAPSVNPTTLTTSRSPVRP